MSRLPLPSVSYIEGKMEGERVERLARRWDCMPYKAEEEEGGTWKGEGLDEIRTPGKPGGIGHGP